MNTTRTGLEALSQTFARARAEKRATFMPFFTIGYPDYPTSLAAVEALVEAGADAVELGVPFSDPLADGPTIQHSSQIALANGTRVADCIEAVRQLRSRGVSVPLILMGYVNPILAYGVGRYTRPISGMGMACHPDLCRPARGTGRMLRCQRPALIPLLARPALRGTHRRVVAIARGFVYLVRRRTSARCCRPADRLRAPVPTTTQPAVGFSINQPR
jgi:tryptophan synthase alpha chain